VYTGIRSARHAAAVAAACCEHDTFTDQALADYERRWKADFGRELEIGFRFFEMRQRLSVQDIDRILQALNDPEIISAIVRYGDMDRPGVLVRKLMRNPAMLSCMGPLIRAGLRSLVR
jgi:flavin-dependent dehydrogenase